MRTLILKYQILKNSAEQDDQPLNKVNKIIEKLINMFNNPNNENVDNFHTN